MAALQILKDARKTIEEYEAFDPTRYDSDIIGAVREAAGYPAPLIGHFIFGFAPYDQGDDDLRAALVALDLVAIARGCTAAPFRSEDRTFWAGASTDWYGMYGETEPSEDLVPDDTVATRTKEWALAYVDAAIELLED